MKHFLIGIAGGSGSGKTTLLKSIFSKFEPNQIALISQDNYYNPLITQEVDANGYYNFDLPTSINRDQFAQDIQRLINGETLEKSEYTFNKATAPKIIYTYPAKIIIVEGLFVFHYEEIYNQLNYKVFLDAHDETRLNRRIHRDTTERNNPEANVRYQWENHVRPAEIKYLDPYKETCDLIIDNTVDFQDDLNKLIDIIKQAL